MKTNHLVSAMMALATLGGGGVQAGFKNQRHKGHGRSRIPSGEWSRRSIGHPITTLATALENDVTWRPVKFTKKKGEVKAEVVAARARNARHVARMMLKRQRAERAAV